MSKKIVDPLKYIEQAFLTSDSNLATMTPGSLTSDARVKPTPKPKFRKTEMRAPRPRRKTETAELKTGEIDPTIQAAWKALPKHIDFLSTMYDDSVTANYYRGKFKESRQELIQRLLDPELSLEETSRLLGVCPATVRRYTNREWLQHHRTPGGQRRFKLSAIIKFVDAHGRFLEE